jgi:hypothetical protein
LRREGRAEFVTYDFDRFMEQYEFYESNDSMIDNE